MKTTEAKYYLATFISIECFFQWFQTGKAVKELYDTSEKEIIVLSKELRVKQRQQLHLSKI